MYKFSFMKLVYQLYRYSGYIKDGGYWLGFYGSNFDMFMKQVWKIFLLWYGNTSLTAHFFDQVARILSQYFMYIVEGKETKILSLPMPQWW